MGTSISFLGNYSVLFSSTFRRLAEARRSRGELTHQRDCADVQLAEREGLNDSRDETMDETTRLSVLGHRRERACRAVVLREARA